MIKVSRNIKKVQYMKNLIKNVHAYFEYLSRTCRLFCSMHFSEGSFMHLSAPLMAELIPHMTHNHPYCCFVKETGHHPQCMRNQKQIILDLEGQDSLVHTCHACVQEILYPIRSEAKHVRGFIAVSAYRGKENGEKQRIYDQTLFNSLQETELPCALTDTLIPPLCMMIERLIEEEADETDSEFKRIVGFLAENHTHVTLGELASHFGRSRSHLSHLFKANAGVSLRAYCNELRLVDAMGLLQSTDLSISEVAYQTGFDDVSYFIKLFREKYGTSPGKYRST